MIDYKVSGTFEDTPVNGKVTISKNGMKKITRKDLLAGKVSGFKQGEKKNKFGTISVYNKELLKKAVSLSIAGTILITSMAGCSKKQAEVVDPEPIEVLEVLEPTQRISYTPQGGEALSQIVAKYCNSYEEIEDEMKNVCSINNMDDPSKIFAGVPIKLDVPVSKLGLFKVEANTNAQSYDISESEALWEKIEYYISNAWTNANHAENNLTFERDRQYVFEGTENAPGYLLQAASEKGALDQMIASPEFYTADDITLQEQKITDLYNKAIELTQLQTGAVYGTDYVYGNITLSSNPKTMH